MAKVTLIKSDEKEPIAKIKCTPGTRIEVVEVEIRDADNKKASLGAATLCGYGNNYCVAAIEV